MQEAHTGALPCILKSLPYSDNTAGFLYTETTGSANGPHLFFLPISIHPVLLCNTVPVPSTTAYTALPAPSVPHDFPSG